MPRPDEARRRHKPDPTAIVPDAPEDAERPPSKTRRKAEMQELRDVGAVLVELEPARFARLAGELALPERLVDAVNGAHAITAWGGRKRAMQYVGKLLREIDADPIRARLDAMAHGRAEDAARMHELERWRERLLTEPDALDLLCAAHPTLDRPRFRALVARTQEERARGTAPHAYRELFRALKALDRAHPSEPEPASP